MNFFRFCNAFHYKYGNFKYFRFLEICKRYSDFQPGALKMPQLKALTDLKYIKALKILEIKALG